MSKAKELMEKTNIIDGYFIFSREEMATFWSQLCKEQRELCQEYVESPWENMNEVPEPSIDD